MRFLRGARPPARRPRQPRGWTFYVRALLLATVAVALAVPTQAVLSEVEFAADRSATGDRSAAGDPAAEPVDPDCLPEGEKPEDPSLERDGRCVERSEGGPSDPGVVEPAPAAPAGEQPPTPPAPASAGGEAPPRSEPPAPSPEPAAPTGDGPADLAAGNRRPEGDRRPARRRRAGADRGDRTPVKPRRRASARRRAPARKRAATRQARRGRATLAPVPAWARSLLAQPLPDPLPAGKRLDPRFARNLQRVAARNGVGWSLVLAVLRVEGREGARPANDAEVKALARRLAALGTRRDPERAVEVYGARAGLAGSAAAATAPGLPGGGGPLGALGGTLGSPAVGGIGPRVTFAERVLALAGYHRAVGLKGLVRGLDAVTPRLSERVLRGPTLAIYPGGRADISAGRIDSRVLVLLLYLAHRHESVVVASLQAGHSFLTKSGNVSNHSRGRAVDVVALDGVSIAGNQEAGGVTERALRNILLLPEELQPSELISLFKLGGPSFAMADHADHIHVGF